MASLGRGPRFLQLFLPHKIARIVEFCAFCSTWGILERHRDEKSAHLVTPGKSRGKRKSKLLFGSSWKPSYLLLQWQFLTLSGSNPLRIWWALWVVSAGNEHSVSCTQWLEFLDPGRRPTIPAWEPCHEFTLLCFSSTPYDPQRSSNPVLWASIQKLTWSREPRVAVWTVGHSFSQSHLNRTSG